MGRRNRIGRAGLSALAATLLIGGAGVMGAPVAGAQDCTGSVTSSLSSDSLPGGTWSVTDGCLTPEAFYEYNDGAVHAEAAITKVTYDDGHVGRVAAGVLTLGDGVGLSVLGVEDEATGLIKWSAVLGDYSQDGDVVGVAGAGVTLFPTEAAQVSVAIAGTGTDITTVLGPDGLPLETTTTTTPTETTAPPASPETSVPPTTVPPTTVAPGGPSTSVPPTTVAPSTTLPTGSSTTTTP
jgi:hypothetical protein